VVAASSELAGSELHPNDLAGLPFVMREEGSATRRAAEEALAAAGQEAKVAMELGSNTAVLAAVAEGAGLVGVVPARQLGDDRRVGRLHVRGLSLRRPFVLLRERGRTLSDAAEAFVAVLTGSGGF
jgi:LysR family transcriptional regulator, low CO2-responsive transcriptional regulator